MNLRFQGKSFNEVYEQMAMELLHRPQHVSTSRKGDVIHEMIDAQFHVENPFLCFATIRRLSETYLRGELDFYMSGSPYLQDIVKHSKFWDKVTDDGETVNSNYGKLLIHDKNEKGYTQFAYALEMLLRNEDSKKAVMTIYSRDHAYKSNDNPCTMYLHFFIRNDKLDLYVKMRSSDIWYGLPYDVPFFVMMQVAMWAELKIHYPKLKIGTYNHQSGSLHLYKRNFSKMVDTLRDKPEQQWSSGYRELNQYKMFTGICKDHLLNFVSDEAKAILTEELNGLYID